MQVSRFSTPYSPCPCQYFRDIDKVDDLMQDITEQQELAQEISDAISKPVGFGEEFDEVSEAFKLERRCFFFKIHLVLN